MLCVALECLKLANRVGIGCLNCPPFGESASPFIDEDDSFTRESVRERECVCFLVLLPTPSGTRRFVGAHNTVDG